jgi:hypothetical protein
MSALAAKNPGQAESFLKNLTTSTAKSFVYPKLAEQITQVIDAAQKNPKHDASSWLGKIMRDMPVVRNKYNVMLNAVGEPIKVDPLQMIGSVKEDPFWEYLTDKNISIGKPDQKRIIYDDISKTERGMTDDEYYHFVKTTGAEIKERIENEVIKENLPDDDARKAVNQIKTDTRKMMMVEMFGWGDFRNDDPKTWELLKESEALQVPKSYIDIKDDKGKKQRLTPEQLKDVNKEAMSIYGGLVKGYLQNKAQVQADKKPNETTGIAPFETITTAYWNGALLKAKANMRNKLFPEKR